MNTMILVRKELLLMFWFICKFLLTQYRLNAVYILNVNYILFIVYACVILSDIKKGDRKYLENVIKVFFRKEKFMLS